MVARSLSQTDQKYQSKQVPEFAPAQIVDNFVHTRDGCHVKFEFICFCYRNEVTH